MTRHDLRKDIAEAALKKALLEYVQARENDTKEALLFRVNIYEKETIIEAEVICDGTSIHGWTL